MMIRFLPFPPTVGREKTGFIRTANTHSDSECILCMDEMGSGGFSFTQSKYLPRNKILIRHFPELKLSNQAKQMCDRLVPDNCCPVGVKGLFIEMIQIDPSLFT